jgi:hypothetical protein
MSYKLESNYLGETNGGKNNLASNTCRYDSATSIARENIVSISLPAWI